MNKKEKKYVVLLGSPRKAGNSALLTEEFIKGIYEVDASANVEKIYLNEQELKTCIGCLKCDQTGECILSDWEYLKETINGADGILLSTAVHSRFVTSAMKTWLDRFRPFMKIEITKEGPKFISRLKGGVKNFVIITTNSARIPQELEPLYTVVEQFIQHISNGGGLVAKVAATGVTAEGQIKFSKEELQALFEKKGLPLFLVDQTWEQNQNNLKLAFDSGKALATAVNNS